MVIKRAIKLNYRNTEPLAIKALDYWKSPDRMKEEQLVTHFFAVTSTILIDAR